MCGWENKGAAWDDDIRVYRRMQQEQQYKR